MRTILIKWISRFLVELYDTSLRMVMPSYYLRISDYDSKEKYRCAISRHYNNSIEYQKNQFQDEYLSNKIFIQSFTRLNKEIKSYLRTEFMYRKNHLLIFYIELLFLTVIMFSPEIKAYLVRDTKDDKILSLYIDYITPKKYYWLVALVSKETNNSKNGSYLSHYISMVETCFQEKIPILRLGPTSKKLKRGLKAYKLFRTISDRKPV